MGITMPVTLFSLSISQSLGANGNCASYGGIFPLDMCHMNDYGSGQSIGYYCRNGELPVFKTTFDRTDCAGDIITTTEVDCSTDPESSNYCNCGGKTDFCSIGTNETHYCNSNITVTSTNYVMDTCGSDDEGSFVKYSCKQSCQGITTAGKLILTTYLTSACSVEVTAVEDHPGSCNGLFWSTTCDKCDTAAKIIPNNYEIWSITNNPIYKSFSVTIIILISSDFMLILLGFYQWFIYVSDIRKKN